MKHLHTALITGATVTALSGCLSGPKPPDSKPPALPEHPAQLRIAFMPDCPTFAKSTPEAIPLAPIGAAILASVGQKVTETAIDRLATYLTHNEVYTLQGNGRMQGFAKWTSEGQVQANNDEQCMIVVIGKDFAPANIDPTEARKLMEQWTAPFADYKKERVRAATGLVGKPLLYLEAQIEFPASPNSPAFFAFAPRAWYFPQFIGDDSWRFSRQRDFLLKIELSLPGSDKAFATLDIQQNAMHPGALTHEQVIDMQQPWIAMPAVMEKVAPGQTFSADETVYPVNAHGLFSETRKPGTLLKYVGEALADQKGTVSAQVSDEIRRSLDQQARLSARDSALSTASSQYEAYLSAYATAEQAIRAYQSASGETRAAALTRARLAMGKLAVARSLAKTALDNAGAGGFEDMPALASLEE